MNEEMVDIINQKKEAFYNRFDVIEKSGCWIWNRAKGKLGYGIFYFKHQGIKYRPFAHRASYAIHNGFFDSLLFVCHKCDCPSCVNPDHLFLGTNEENIKDRVDKDRSAKGEKNGNCKLTDFQISEIRNSNETVDIISIKYKISQAYVCAIIKNKTRVDNNYIPKNKLNFKKPKTTSLDDNDVVNVRRLIVEGLKTNQISLILGIKNQTIRDIKRGVCYKNKI